jgi:uncharacterized protein
MSARRAWARRLPATAVLAAALTLAAAAPSRSDDTPLPQPAGFVTDSAGVIGPHRSAQIESFLDEFKRRTGVPFAVVTMRTTEPDGPVAYKTRLFNAWKVWNPANQEGLLLLVDMEARRVVFETGYGLEGTLPDGWQSRMLRDLVVPRFRAGEFADGITVAVLACAERVATEKGVTVSWTGDELHYGSGRGTDSEFPGWVAALLVFLVFSLVTGALRGGRRRRRGWWIGGGPWIGGGWGGGFGGGGGGGGGGGFGGFGGGGGFGSGGGGGGAGW